MMAQPAQGPAKAHTHPHQQTHPSPHNPDRLPQTRYIFPFSFAGGGRIYRRGGGRRQQQARKIPPHPAAHTVLFAHAALARKHGHRERDETAAAVRQRRNGGEGAATAERCMREPCFLAPLVLPRRTDHVQLPPSPAGTTTAPAVLHRVFESFFTAARR